MLNEINDIREKFNTISFSGYQKSKVKKELNKCLEHNKLENSCYWTAELICSGHFIDLWDTIIIFFCKNINLGNPKLAIYIDNRYNIFKNIINSYNNNELLLRNNINIRKLFCEIICILIYSNKKLKINEIKIDNDDIINFINISEKLKANDNKIIKKYFKDDDPKEIYIPINELIYSLENLNLQDSIYWIEWIIQFEIYCNKNNKQLNTSNRLNLPINYQKDIINIIWDIIIDYSKKNNLIYSICKSLYNIFFIKYSKSSKKKRRIIIYFALQLLIEKYDKNIDIISNKDKIVNIVANVDKIYKEIKKNEQLSDEKINHIKNINTNKSLHKLNILNNFTNNNYDNYYNNSDHYSDNNSDNNSDN